MVTYVDSGTKRGKRQQVNQSCLCLYKIYCLRCLAWDWWNGIRISRRISLSSIFNMILSNKGSPFCSRLFYLFYEPSRLCQSMRTIAAATTTTTPMTRQAKHNHHLASSPFSPCQMFGIVMPEADDTVFLCDIFLLWQAWNPPPLLPPSEKKRKNPSKFDASDRGFFNDVTD